MFKERKNIFRQRPTLSSRQIPK